MSERYWLYGRPSSYVAGTADQGGENFWLFGSPEGDIVLQQIDIEDRLCIIESEVQESNVYGASEVRDIVVDTVIESKERQNYKAENEIEIISECFSESLDIENRWIAVESELSSNEWGAYKEDDLINIESVVTGIEGLAHFDESGIVNVEAESESHDYIIEVRYITVESISESYEFVIDDKRIECESLAWSNEIQMYLNDSEIEFDSEISVNVTQSYLELFLTIDAYGLIENNEWQRYSEESLIQSLSETVSFDKRRHFDSIDIEGEVISGGIDYWCEFKDIIVMTQLGEEDILKYIRWIETYKVKSRIKERDSYNSLINSKIVETSKIGQKIRISC